MATQNQPASSPPSTIQMLASSPYPLSVSDVAELLGTDEITAAQVVQLMRDAGRARLDPGTSRWIFH